MCGSQRFHIEPRLFCVSIAPAIRSPLVLSVQAGRSAEILISRQLNLIVVVALCWLSAGSLGIAPSALRMARRRRGTSCHRPCVDSRQPIWPTRRHQVQAGVRLRPLRDSRWHHRACSFLQRTRSCDRQPRGRGLCPRWLHLRSRRHPVESRHASGARSGHRHGRHLVHRKRESPWPSPRRCVRRA